MKNKFNVLIVGAGKIGAFFDNPKSKNILTHAHAFSCHKGFHLLGFIDTDKKRSAQAAKIWKTAAFEGLGKAFEKNRIDVVCITASTDKHRELLEKVLKFPVKSILLEKPVAKNINELKEIIELCNKTKVPITVNYIRRFLPEFEKIKKNISKGKYGNFVGGTGYYGKGILNNGSHLIDLLHFFIGEFSDFEITGKQIDFSPEDPTVSAVLNFSDKKSFILQGIDCQVATLFELDLIFEKQRIRIIESGQKIEFYKIQKNRKFKGYQNMIKYCDKETSLDKYMRYVVDNIYRNLTGNEKVRCNVSDGCKAAEACFRLMKK